MPDTYTIKRGATRPALRYSAGVDLTGATARFVMADRPGAVPVVDAPAEVAGEDLIYRWTATDTLTARAYYAEFRVTFPSGGVQVFPTDAYLAVEIMADLGGATAGPSEPGAATGSGSATEGADTAAGTGNAPVAGSGAATEGGDTASGSGTVAAPAPSIGGTAIGTMGAAGTIYEGYQLADGDDFDTAPDFLTPGNANGAYMTTRNYGIQSGAPRYLRGAASLGGYEADPWHSGFADAGRGVVPASFSDTISVAGGSLTLKSRRATAAEKALMGPLSDKGNLSSMVHLARRNMLRAPCLIEMRLRFPYSLASWDQWHPTFWVIQSQPGNGWDGLELDCEGFSPALQFNRNTWENGVGAFGPTLGTTQNVSKTTYRNYAFEIVQVNGAWTVRLWEDGVLRGEGSPDYGGRVLDPTRPFHIMFTNHILQSGLNQSVFDAAGDAGALIECDWWRTWSVEGSNFRKPLGGAVTAMTDFDAPFSLALAPPAAVWGADVTSDVIEMIPNEDNTPAAPWVRGLLPASVTRTGDTLSGRISDRPGRLILARSATPGVGDGCIPQPITICVGPRITTTALSYNVGVGFTFDAYAAVDCGDLHMGKQVTVSGLPAWATFDPATGLVTGTPTDTGNTSITVTGINAMGQSVSKALPLQKAATPSGEGYQSWTGPGWFDMSDAGTLTASGTVIASVANKRSGGESLTAAGAAISTVAGGMGGRQVARFTRDTSGNPARLSASQNGVISAMCRGEDKPYTVITVFNPTDTNTGYIWGWSDTVDSTNSQQIALIRRASAQPSVRRQLVEATSNDVRWGTSHPANTPRIVAVQHTGTAVTIWDNSLTPAVSAAAQDVAAFNNELAFYIGASETLYPTDPFFSSAACAMDMGEIVIESRAVPDADIQQAITDMAAKWGITLS